MIRTHQLLVRLLNRFVHQHVCGARGGGEWSFVRVRTRPCGQSRLASCPLWVRSLTRCMWSWKLPRASKSPMDGWRKRQSRRARRSFQARSLQRRDNARIWASGSTATMWNHFGFSGSLGQGWWARAGYRRWGPFLTEFWGGHPWGREVSPDSLSKAVWGNSPTTTTRKSCTPSTCGRFGVGSVCD